MTLRMSCCNSHKPSHFKGKEAVEHVIEAQTKGILSSTEVHGMEMPGHISAFADTARETTMALLLLSLFNFSWQMMALFAFGWLVWKLGRAAWLGWTRLERLHRVMAEEKWEIEHHRTQEREELSALYEAKGFKGKLLEDVMDVLMADGDRLLKVMLEEELGLSLGQQEHPLKQGIGAALGAFIASFFALIGWGLYGTEGLLVMALLIGLGTGYLSAFYEKNRIIPAMIWNVSLIAISYGTTYFLLKFIQGFTQ